ncbi:hypothetical protein ACB092_11G180900 [Castanea dentata]
MMSLRMMPRSLLPRPNITRELKNAKLVNLEKEVCYRVHTWSGCSRSSLSTSARAITSGYWVSSSSGTWERQSLYQ